MKRFIKNITTLLLIPAMLVGVFVTSCKKDNSGGTPKIQLVRVTNPLKSDSLLTGAYLGNLIVLVGENLSGVKQIWFNDRKANLNPTYITDNTVFVSVPNDVPNVVSNQMKLVFGTSDTLTYPFNVLVPAPKISSLKCEYVAAGDSAVIIGDYFYDPQVFFVGDQPAEVLSFTKTRIQVKVPDAAAIGPITVKNRFGKMASSQIFRDDRGIFLDFDNKKGAGWRPGLQVQNTNPTGCAGNYNVLSFKFNSTKDNWNWSEDNGDCDLWGQAAGRPNGPLFNVTNFSKATLKFEAYTIVPWSAGWIHFIFMPWSNANNSAFSDNTVARGFWRPWFDNSKEFVSNGWITVSIPLSDFKYSRDGKTENLSLKYPDNCGSLSTFLYGPPLVENVDITTKIAIDNIRVIE